MNGNFHLQSTADPRYIKRFESHCPIDRYVWEPFLDTL